MENNKYELTDETMLFNGKTKRILHRIRALKDIYNYDFNGFNVKAGELGGWIEKEENLSHDGSCWVFEEAKVFDNAYVFGNAAIAKGSIVCESAMVGDSAIICSSWVFDHAKVRSGESRSCVYNSKVYGNAFVVDGMITDSKIYDDAWIDVGTICKGCLFGRASIKGNSGVKNVNIGGDTVITDETWIKDENEFTEYLIEQKQEEERQTYKNKTQNNGM